MKENEVYIVSEVVDNLGIPDIVGVFSTPEIARNLLERVAKWKMSKSKKTEDFKDFSNEEVDKFIEEHYSIDRWLVDSHCLRG